MPAPAAAWHWLAAALLALLAWAVPPAQAAPLLLDPLSETIDLGGRATGWLDATGAAGPAEALRSPGPWRTNTDDTIWDLAHGTVLWLRLELKAQVAGRPQHWLLVLPNPLLDRAVVWQRDPAGRWRADQAGDTLAVQTWAERSRYPVFRLDLPAGETREVLVELHSAVGTSVPMRIAAEDAHLRQSQLESLGLGLAFGALLLLIAACLAMSAAFRDRVYGAYAAYAGLSTLAAAAYTGLGAQWLWPGSAMWADAAPGTLAILAVGAACVFLRQLLGLPARHLRLDVVMQWVGAAGLPLAFAYLFGPREPLLQALSAYLLLVSALTVAAAWLTWRRGDRVGLWVLVAYVPLILSIGAAVVRLMGLLPISFFTQYAVVVAMVLEVPLLLIALSVRSRDRHAAQIREQALSNQDALTGLLAPHIFEDRLRQALLRFRRDGDDCAVVFIDLVNHDRIRAVHGPAVAEQSLLRSVIKLRRVVRDVDTLGRIGEARFGLILDGVGARAAVTDRAARLIAAGLMPLPGLKPEVTLQFHLAAAVLRERLLEPEALHAELAALLAAMSPRTRRPIRFLKPEETKPLEMDSELPEQAAA